MTLLPSNDNQLLQKLVKVLTNVTNNIHGIQIILETKLISTVLSGGGLLKFTLDWQVYNIAIDFYIHVPALSVNIYQITKLS